MIQILIRFLVGGAAVSMVALVGDLLKPKSFAGLFGAAPSVALATLGLTVATEGAPYAALEARSMVVGAVAFFIYASLVSWIDHPSFGLPGIRRFYRRRDRSLSKRDGLQPGDDRGPSADPFRDGHRIGRIWL